VLDTGTHSVLCMRYDWRNNSVLFLHNLDSRPREISFSVGLKDDQGKLLVNLLTEDHSRADERGRHDVLLEPYGYRWYRVGGLDYLLKRSEIDVDPRAKRGGRRRRSTKG
jgi:maltose alpha-D-glucosyltransferase/alpha-amylase